MHAPWCLFKVASFVTFVVAFLELQLMFVLEEGVVLYIYCDVRSSKLCYDTN